MTMRAPRAILLVFLAALAVVVAGCGGAAQKGKASSTPGATMVTAHALAYVTVSSDLGSSQWKQVDELSQKFPGRDKAIAQIKKSLSAQNVDYTADIKPALGSEVDFAVVNGATPSEVSYAALTKPEDPLRFKALVAKLNQDSSGPGAVDRDLGNGWFALSKNQQMIDRVVETNESNSLAHDPTFNDGLAKLPSEAIAKAYVNGPELATLLRQAVQQSNTQLDLSSLGGIDKLDFISASLSAESDGVRLKGAVSGSGSATLGSGEYTSKLMDGVPGDALAFLTFQGGGLADQFQKLMKNPQIAPGIKQFEQGLGISVNDILDLFRNEVGFYARPGSPIPEFTLVLGSSDEQKAMGTIDKLFTSLGATGMTQPCPTTDQGGVTMKCVTISSLAVHYGASDGKVFITTGPSAVSEYKSSGNKLADDTDFKDAKAAAGMPDSTGGFTYVNLKDTIPMIETLAGLGGSKVPPDVSANLDPLRSLLAWGAGSGDTRTFDVFLEIK
jgi:Protein of unknown function (DUF3352)